MDVPVQTDGDDAPSDDDEQQQVEEQQDEAAEELITDEVDELEGGSQNNFFAGIYKSRVYFFSNFYCYQIMLILSCIHVSMYVRDCMYVMMYVTCKVSLPS